jgi:hypothetical protein
MRLAFALLAAVAACSHTPVSGQPDGGASTPDASTCMDPSCMPCEQGTNDHCPVGQYCLPDHHCDVGCKNDMDCNTGEGCCNHTCTALGTLQNCGSCGDACATGDFCNGTQCNTPTYPNFCANPTVYEIYDGITADNHAADVMASTITANCPSTVTVHTANQSDAALVDQTTGQPLAGSGVTYVLGGGPFPNKPLHWLEKTQNVTRIYFDAPDGVHYYWKVRGTDAIVASMTGSSCSPHADQFIIELVTDPMSGTLSLIGYGACSGGKGTLSAAWFYANQLLPNASSYPDSWYIFGWSDTDNDSSPSAGDTFTVLAHGL